MYGEDTNSDSDKDKDTVALTMDDQIILCKEHLSIQTSFRNTMVFRGEKHGIPLV